MLQKPKFFQSESLIPRGAKHVDASLSSREELFKIRNPFFAKQPFKNRPEWKRFLKEVKGIHQWVYFPWDNTAVKILDENIYFELRTARNRNLITQSEQIAYRNLKVGIAGLSVGSSILSALVLSGGPKTLKIADFDTLETTNLNRIRGGLADIGKKKIELAARDVWRVDPFSNIALYPNGLTEKTLQSFMLDKPRLDIFIDEMDDLSLKVAARIIAKRERMPVLMATDNGDSVLLDVERFDLEPRRPIFHGLVKNLTVQSVRNAKGKRWLASVEKIIGGPWMPERHRSSLKEIGKTLAGVPQLGTDAITAGAVMSIAVRKIGAGDELPSGRYVLGIENAFQKAVID
jgi:hypothetical protein